MYKKLAKVKEYVAENNKEVETIEIVFAKEKFGCIPSSDFEYVVFHGGGIFHNTEENVSHGTLKIFIDSHKVEELEKACFQTIEGVNPRIFAETKTLRSASFLFREILFYSDFCKNNPSFPYEKIPKLYEEDEKFYYLTLFKPV